MNKQNRKACVYCGRETNVSVDQCANCGSTSFESLEQAEQHQEQHRQFNQQRQVTQPYTAKPTQKVHNVDKKKRLISVGIVAVIAVTITVILIQALSGVKTTTHKINSLITTDWFKMTVYEGKIVRSKNSYGGLNAPPAGHERVMIDINLVNHRSDENLDINIAEDFYLEAGSRKFATLNTGGSYSIFDRLSTDGMYFGRFMVSPQKELHGYIAFDIPASISNLRFVYEEYNYDGDERTTLKHFYKVDLEYDMPRFPSEQAKVFYNMAYNAGYIMEIINDYDGFDTFWVGAHKYIDESSKGITKKPEPVYWIDCTMDTTEHNAQVEYKNYVDKVIKIGGTADKSSGTVSGVSYQYQCNVSSTKFGLAYQIGVFNYLVETAPIEYMGEILEFLDSLDIKVGKT